MIIDYRKKLTTHREINQIDNLDISIESDRGRIISAPSFRRLQKRTQVFPLELNAAVRTRLTHSIEVAQTARYISKKIVEKLDDKNLKKLENAFISTAEMASLLHDIGNPPFGHFAEISINNWMSKNAIEIIDNLYKIDNKNLIFKNMLIQDICNFDGNAQAIRTVTKLQRLNLSYTQLASIIKYTRGAYQKTPKKSDKFSYLKKKPGFYYSEKELVKKIYKKLDIKSGCRFPITYIMEAADDISYLNADIEDAVDKKILSFEDVYRLIKSECKILKDDYLFNLIEEFYNKVKKQEQEPYQFNLFLTLVKAKLTNELVEYVSDIYVKNHRQIFNGKFNYALLEFDKNSKYTKSIEILKNISKKYIYTNKDVQTLELKGYTILTGLLDKYKPLLKLDKNEFNSLIIGDKIKCFISMRLIKRLSPKHIVAYKNSINSINSRDSQRYNLQEWYYRARLILDYISGMTDDFALYEYQTLMAIDK